MSLSVKLGLVIVLYCFVVLLPHMGGFQYFQCVNICPMSNVLTSGWRHTEGFPGMIPTKTFGGRTVWDANGFMFDFSVN